MGSPCTCKTSLNLIGFRCLFGFIRLKPRVAVLGAPVHATEEEATSFLSDATQQRLGFRLFSCHFFSSLASDNPTAKVCPGSTVRRQRRTSEGLRPIRAALRLAPDCVWTCAKHPQTLRIGRRGPSQTTVAPPPQVATRSGNPRFCFTRNA